MARAASSIPGVMSTPITSPSGPARSAAMKEISPVPHPTSRTLRPDTSPAFLNMNLCQPFTMPMDIMPFILS